jgi:hypothetical protein
MLPEVKASQKGEAAVGSIRAVTPARPEQRIGPVRNLTAAGACANTPARVVHPDTGGGDQPRQEGSPTTGWIAGPAWRRVAPEDLGAPPSRQAPRGLELWVAGSTITITQPQPP